MEFKRWRKRIKLWWWWLDEFRWDGTPICFFSKAKPRETLRKKWRTKKSSLSHEMRWDPQSLTCMTSSESIGLFKVEWTCFLCNLGLPIASNGQNPLRNATLEKTDFWTARRALLSARRADHFFGFARSARTTLEAKTAKFSSARRALFSARRALPGSLHTVF